MPTELDKQLRIRTLAIPLSLMLVHAMVINTLSNVYATVYQLLSQSAQWSAYFKSYASVDELILREYPRISVLYSLALIPLYAVILILRKTHDPNAFWMRRPSWSEIWPALTVIIGMLGVTNLIFNLLITLSASYPQISAMMTDYMSRSNAFSPDIGYVWLILGISILAPVSEELLFRGIIQGELRRAMPEWAAVVVQAVLFALFHMQPVQVMYVILPALALGALYALTRSLWVPILMHITFNFLGSVVPAMIGDDATLIQLVALTEIAFIAVAVVAGYALYLRRRES